MTEPSSIKTVLGFQNSVPILIYLYEAGGSAKSGHLREAIGNYNSIKSAASRLEEAGLIKITSFSGKSAYILYELTDLGTDIARDLKRANDRLNGLLPEPEDNPSTSPEPVGQTTNS